MKKNPPLLSVSFHPFAHSRIGYAQINYILILLLLPAVVHGIGLYGLYAVRVVGASILFCMLWDMFFEKLFRRPLSIYDGSAAMTGMVLGMLMSPQTPWWIILVASGCTMFFGKQLFGGAGGSPFNAICLGWAVVMVSWPNMVDPTFGSVGLSLPVNIEYPLAELRRLGPGSLEKFPVMYLLMGNQAGCIGTGASILLYMGGCAGILIGSIPWIIPASFLGAMVVTAVMFSGEASAYQFAAFHILTGFSCIGAFFLASDFSSRPQSKVVMIWYGAAVGALTVLFRMWSSFPEGLPFALLIVNMTIPLLDRGRAPEKKPSVEVIRI